MAGERALPGLGLYGFWNAGTGGWKTETDNNWRKLSALLHLSVKSNTTVLPTGANGDIYIVPTGQPNAQKIAVKDNGSWVYIDPLEGMRAFIKDQDVFKWFNGINWITEGAALAVFQDHAEFMALVSEIDFVGNGVDLEEDEDNPGRLIITIQRPETFGELPQVDFSTPIADGQTLVWDGPAQKFKPGDAAGGGGLEDAPSDGELYARQDGAWVAFTPGGGGGGGGIPDAPNDGKSYVRANGDWSELPGAITVPKKFRRYRLNFPTSIAPYPCISEVAALALDGSNIQIDSIVASTQYGGSYAASMAIDGNINTFWHSGTNTANEYLEVRFNEPVAVNSFTLTVQGQADSQRPTSVSIEGSADTVTYEELLPVQTISWAGGGPRTVNLPLPEAQEVLDLASRLLGGVAGQVLAKASTDDFDFEWVTPSTGAAEKRKFDRYRVTLGSGGELLLSTLSFRDSTGTTRTPVSATTNDSNTGDVPKLFDDNAATFWYGGQPRYFDCLFAAAFALEEVYLLQNNGQAYKNPTSLKVEGYEGGWVTLHDGGITMTPYAGNNNNGEYTQAIDTGAAPEPAPQSYRYFRMTVASSLEGNNCAFSEWAFYTEDGVRQIASAMTANRDNGSDTAAKLNDKDPGTWWHSPTGNVPGSVITADLGAIKAISKIKIVGRPGLPNQAPNNFTIAGSNAGTTYTDIGVYQPVWADNVPYEIEYAPTDPEPQKSFKETFVDVYGSNQQVSSGSFTKLDMPMENSDEYQNYNAGTSCYIVPQDGIYMISASLRIADSEPAGVQYGIGVHTSENDGAWFLWHEKGSATRTTYPYSRIKKCVAGEQLRLYTYTSATVTFSAYGMQIIQIA